MKKIVLFMSLLSASLLSHTQPRPLGVFDDHADVGNPSLKGNAVYNDADQTYTLSAAGKNVWGREDQFHFLFKRLKGDFIVKATVHFVGEGVAGHRKLGVMARDKLTTDSRYADGTFHGGEPLNTSLQYRLNDGDTTGQALVSSIHPTEIEFERTGNVFNFSAATYGENYKTVSRQMALNDDVYVGLYLCSHLDTVVEKAVFSNVRIVIPPAKNYTPYRDYIGSNLEVMDISTGLRKVLYTVPGSIQCPNWTRDGGSLIYNSAEGLMYKHDLAVNKPSLLNTGFAKSNNNDHVLSFDGQMLAISNYTGQRISTIYTLPVTGSDAPVKITSEDSGHSYLHGWSPDGKKLVFTGQRKGVWDIWSVDIVTKKETNLTNTPTLDDGAEYSPDGKWIYFNSVRTGTMKLWRMKPEGSGQEQVTFDEYNDWFPHFSPDGRWIVFVSFPKEIDPATHPFYQKIYLRLMPASGGVPRNIAYVYGGQGTMNVPGWSPDGKRIAFISNTKF